MKVAIGKNTLGGGKKMTTRLNNYNRSTHDLSTIVRTTAAVGTLIPTLKLFVQPGDTIPIQIRCHTLTHPTIGPLFGSFKQQNDFFFCPIRLYHAMLHNNALNIGLDMKKVKFPYIRLTTSNWVDEYLDGSANTLKKEVHPSSLFSYLGYKRFRDDLSDQDNGTIQVLPVLMYYDIFKNYYANKQEKSFYQIVADGNFIYSINPSSATNTFYFGIYSKVASEYPEIKKIEQNPPSIKYQNPTGTEYYIGFTIQANQPIDEDTVTLLIKDANFDNKRLYRIQGSLQSLIDTGIITKVPTSNGTNTATYILNETQTTAGADGTSTVVHSFSTIGKVEMQFFGSNYAQYDLSEIDEMRENILAAGRVAWEANSRFITAITKTIQDPNIAGKRKHIPASAFPMVGLVLKTYQSDINTNWVNTEWIEGENGINSITAIDTSGGSFTLDTLNLAKKVYTMLNRIAVSDGSYNAWIQTVYTSGGLNHVETPIYLGGSSLEIEFQEVINNSGTEDQPLGTLAGRGVTTNYKGGNIVFKADEPGYLFCITSITPRVDYYQGNDWDIYLKTMNDIHKPQLDGIGFQDRLYRNVNANVNKISDLERSIGKQPAWIEYMTNVNRTYGNFALLENEGWMCLNRIFGEIDSYTTYVQPHLYNNIFADTDLTAQNFWIQIGFNIKPRRVMSAKVIPNI